MTFKTVDAVVSGFGGSLNSESAESSPLAPDQPNLLVFLADKDPPTNRSRCAVPDWKGKNVMVVSKVVWVSSFFP
nr:PREDICTED: uncharacterized protein LOC108951233 isoform X2 [Musa acuminata subsp. malaccensis]